MTTTIITHVALIGTGRVGAAVLRLLCQPPLNDKFLVVAIANSRKMKVSYPTSTSTPLSPLHLDDPAAQPFHYPNVTGHLSMFSNPTIIDCTATDTIPALYPFWLGLGIHVVTPNKKGFAGSVPLYHAIRNAARVPTGTVCDPQARAGLVYHESSVGAGLPVLSTVADLVDSGDRIVLMEGVFSGTLSYLFNLFASQSNNLPFSAIVAKARQLGYTEPDPRDDLNGMDVARKVVILARAAGLTNVSVDTVTIESLVPEPLRNTTSVDEFMSGLAQYDTQYTSRRQEAAMNKAVLRYVGRIDVVKQTATVSLQACPIDHPLAALQGADNLVRIVTERFPGGIVIQGAGAGDEVTAHGVVTDLLRVHRMGHAARV